MPPEMLKEKNGKKFVDWKAATHASVIYMLGKAIELISYKFVSHKVEGSMSSKPDFRTDSKGTVTATV